MGRPEQRERERKRSAKLCKSLDTFFLSKKRKMAENCTESAATFTLSEGETTDSNGSLQLPDDDQSLHNVDQGTRNVDQGTQNVTQTPSEVVDVNIDGE